MEHVDNHGLPSSLSLEDMLATQQLAIANAIRALFGAHPNKPEVLRIFDLLCAQAFASKDYVANPDKAKAVKAWGDALFAPPVEIEM